MARIGWIGLTAIVALSACSRSMTINVAFVDKAPQFILAIPGERQTPCIYLFEIIDVHTEKSVIRRHSPDPNKCVTRKVVQFRPGSGDTRDLVPGRHYRAEAIADGYTGRSEVWTAK